MAAGRKCQWRAALARRARRGTMREQQAATLRHPAPRYLQAQRAAPQVRSFRTRRSKKGAEPPGFNAARAPQTTGSSARPRSGDQAPERPPEPTRSSASGSGLHRPAKARPRPVSDIKNAASSSSRPRPCRPNRPDATQAVTGSTLPPEGKRAGPHGPEVSRFGAQPRTPAPHQAAWIPQRLAAQCISPPKRIRIGIRSCATLACAPAGCADRLR